ncbi:MAG: AAA family ATPase [Capsulimonadales bacterium]|nr:AAA family ATPase [Capsulimonadales bacterium]
MTNALRQTRRKTEAPVRNTMDLTTGGDFSHPLDTVLDCATDARVPLLLWGPPGIGKSALVTSWARRRGLPCWTVIASLREPADFGGLPLITHGGDGEASVTFAPPRFAQEAARDGGVIFLDELTTAPPAVQAALLRAVVDRAFGDLQMDPDKVTILAAANPPEYAAGGWDLAAPLANRFLHQTFLPDAGEWVESFAGYWGQPPRLSFNGRGVSETAWADARSLVSTFLRSRPRLLLALPAEESRRGGAWPSPRSWDYASRILAGNRGRLSEILPLLSGCVGEGAAVEFCHWLREMDLPDPDELLASPKSYIHPDRADRAYAILSSVTQRAISTGLSPKRWEAAWTILASAAEAGGADVAAAAARALARSRGDREDLPLPRRELMPFLPVLRSAGILG